MFLAECGIVDNDASSRHRLEHDEVIHIPMQDGREVQLGEVS